MTNKEIIDDVIRREGGAIVTNDSVDRGGRTQYGISERSNAYVWRDGKVTEDEARNVYEKSYIEGPGFNKIPDTHGAVKHQLVDFGVMSGPTIAIMSLQRTLGVTVDGKLGPKTLSALSKAEIHTVNNLLVKERVLMIGRICKKAPSQLRFIDGWLRRALDFII